MANKRKPDPRPKPKPAPAKRFATADQIKRVIPRDVPVLFMDGLVVQHTEEAFFLSFLQTEHTLAVTDEERSKIKEINQIARVRIAVTPSQMAKCIAAMNINFGKFIQSHTPLGDKISVMAKEYNKKLIDTLNAELGREPNGRNSD